MEGDGEDPTWEQPCSPVRESRRGEEGRGRKEEERRKKGEEKEKEEEEVNCIVWTRI